MAATIVINTPTTAPHFGRLRKGAGKVVDGHRRSISVGGRRHRRRHHGSRARSFQHAQSQYAPQEYAAPPAAPVEVQPLHQIDDDITSTS